MLNEIAEIRIYCSSIIYNNLKARGKGADYSYLCLFYYNYKREAGYGYFK